MIRMNQIEEILTILDINFNHENTNDRWTWFVGMTMVKLFYLN